MERFRIDIGHNDSVMPGNIVGAIANEAGLDAKDIGRINIFDSYSTVDLPLDMPAEIFKDLKNTCIARKRLNITRFTGETEQSSGAAHDADFADRPVRRKPKSKPKSKTAGKTKDKNKSMKRGKPKVGKKPARPASAGKKRPVRR